MFAASCDPIEKNAKFAKELELDYPILSDPSKKIATLHGVVDDDRLWPRRWTIFVAKDGKVAYIEKNVKPGGHGKQVLAKLAELKVEKATKETAKKEASGSDKKE